MRISPTLLTLLLAALAVLLAAAGLSFGTVSVPVEAAWKAVLGTGTDEATVAIVRTARLPRVLTAAGAGAALALAGWCMQTLFRNPLAGPSILGITNGSSLGVALLLMGTATGWLPSWASGHSAIALTAMLGAMLVLLLVLWAARRLGDATTLLIFGIMLGYLTGAIESALQFRAESGALRNFVMWSMGSFAQADMTEAFLIAIATLTAGAVLFFLLTPMNLLLMGEQDAASLGVHTGRLRIALVAISGWLSGIVTAWCGPVAFIGLAVPHLARLLLRTSDHRVLFAPLALLGAITGLGSDLAARMLEFPLNAVTAAIGAPVIMLVLLRPRLFRIHA